MEKQKLPKQWKHWCKDQRLRTTWGKNWFNLMGRGHFWRINCHGMFQRGDTYEDFDRWALCDIKEVPMPKTRQEFRDSIKFLLEK